MNWLNDGRVMSDVVWYNSNGKSSSHCVFLLLDDGTMTAAAGAGQKYQTIKQVASAKIILVCLNLMMKKEKGALLLLLA